MVVCIKITISGGNTTDRELIILPSTLFSDFSNTIADKLVILTKKRYDAVYMKTDVVTKAFTLYTDFNVCSNIMVHNSCSS